MRPVLTPEEMGAADRRAIASGTPGAVLMERAGHAVAAEARRLLGGTYGRRAVVACGQGNNGGDGEIAARVLRAAGVRVAVMHLADPWPAPRWAREVRRADLLVDAMYGTGFRGVLDGPALEVARASSSVATLAVDIPSGVDGATGAVDGIAVRAVRTVTFAAAKPGLWLQPGRAHAGEIVVADIGIATFDPEGAPSMLGVTDATDVAAWLPDRDAVGNKWSVGAVFVVGGSLGMTGAPQLVSHAALRAGAGIVWCGVPGREAASAAGGSEIVVHALPATADGALAPEAAAVVSGDAGRFGAVVVGPGLGRAAPTETAVRLLLDEVATTVVLDADGLNALRGDLEPLRRRAAAGRATVLTPHDGEYARLVGAPPGPDRVGAARRLADRAGATVLLKGPTTIVAGPGNPGPAALNPTGSAALATAGAGDVLSGIIGAFCARGVSGFAAAAAGAFVHGRAADVAGHTGLVAGDLVAALPVVLAGP